MSIFGGATQMDRVARVMRDLMRERGSDKPVIFRLDGTNADVVQGFLREVGARNHSTLEAAVKAAVERARSSQ